MIFYNKTLFVLPHFSIFIWKECVHTDFPLHSHRKLRKLHDQCFPICIHAVEHNIITDIILISPCIHNTDQPAVIICTAIPWETIVDTDLRQFTCRRFCSLTQDRIIFPQADRIAEEIVDFFVFFQSVPIQPRCDIILTVRVVISKLCIAEFISCKNIAGPRLHINVANAFLPCGGASPRFPDHLLRLLPHSSNCFHCYHHPYFPSRFSRCASYYRNTDHIR